MEPIIEFSIANQIIKRTDEFCVVSDSRNYLYARFKFDTNDWDGITKTAVFSNDGENYGVILDTTNPAYSVEHDAYKVPWEFIKPGVGTVTVFGGDLVTANCAYVRIEQSGYTEDVQESITPSPSMFEELMSMIAETRISLTNMIRECEIALENLQAEVKKVDEKWSISEENDIVTITVKED